MIDLEAKFTKLSQEWLNVIGGEHYKDRDCHFYIQRKWSYGDPPKWFAQHYGYWIKDFDVECETYEDCLRALILKLQEEIKEARECIKRTQMEEEEYWAEMRAEKGPL